MCAILLLAFTHLGHEYQDHLESMRWKARMHMECMTVVRRLDLGLYSHLKEFGVS